MLLPIQPRIATRISPATTAFALTAACAVLLSPGHAAANVKGTSPYLPDPGYTLPAPERTIDCDFSPLDGLDTVYVKSGDVAGLEAAAGAGGTRVVLAANGHWLLQHTLHVAPRTILEGAQPWPNNPVIEAGQPMDPVVQLTELDRIDGVGIYGQISNGHYGVVAHGWTDGLGNHRPMDRIQIWNSTISEVTHHGVSASGGTCLQVYNTRISGALSCWQGVPTGGAMLLQDVRFTDLDEVELHGAHVFGLRGREVADLYASWVHVGSIATDTSLPACGALPEKFRGVGMLFENSKDTESKYGLASVVLSQVSMDFIHGYGLFFTGRDLEAGLDHIRLTAAAQAFGDAENAVVAVYGSADVCIDAAPSTAPLSLLACGPVSASCGGAIPVTPNACVPGQW